MNALGISNEIILENFACTVRAPVFGTSEHYGKAHGRAPVFGTSEHYGKAHGSLLSG